MSHLSASMRSKITFIKASKRDAATDTREIEATVRDIIANVRDRGDAAYANIRISLPGIPP